MALHERTNESTLASHTIMLTSSLDHGSLVFYTCLERAAPNAGRFPSHDADSHHVWHCSQRQKHISSGGARWLIIWRYRFYLDLHVLDIHRDLIPKESFCLYLVQDHPCPWNLMLPSYILMPSMKRRGQCTACKQLLLFGLHITKCWYWFFLLYWIASHTGLTVPSYNEHCADAGTLTGTPVLALKLSNQRHE